jgi:drug/metabolite transporter (DMT)-like permease
MRFTAAGCGAIALWAFLAPLSRAVADIPPLEVTAIALAVSAVLGLGVVAVRGRLSALRQPPVAWLHGVGGLAGYHLLYFAAIGLAPAAQANLLNYLWPLLIVLLSAPVLGLVLRRRHALGAALAGLGCAVLLLPALHGGGAIDGAAWLGYGCALAAALVWSLYSVLSRKLDGVATEAVAGFCAGAALLAGLAHVLFERSVIPDATGWLVLLVLGIGPVGAAFFLWDIGMKRGDPRLLGTLAYATPVASTGLLCLFGFSAWSPSLLLAALLVAAGGLVAARP